MEIQIVIPKGFFGASSDDSPLETALRRIARACLTGDSLYEQGVAEKYGANYENSVFIMHRYCWCEEDECPWCSGEAPNFLYKPTSFIVEWYKYIGRGMKASGELSEEELAAMVAACVRSLKEETETRIKPETNP